MEDSATTLQYDHVLKPHGNLGPSSSAHRTHVSIRSKNRSRRRPEQCIAYEDVFGGQSKYSLPSHTSVFAGATQQFIFPASLQNYDDVFRMPAASNSSIKDSSYPEMDARPVDCDLLGRPTGTRKKGNNVSYNDVFGGVSRISTGPEVLADLLLGVFNGRQNSSKIEQNGLLSGNEIGKKGMASLHQTASDKCAFGSTVETLDRGQDLLQEKEHIGKAKTLDMDVIFLRENCVKKEHSLSNPLFQEVPIKFADAVEFIGAYQRQHEGKPWVSVSEVKLVTGPTTVAPPARAAPYHNSSMTNFPYTLTGSKMSLQETVDAIKIAELYNSESEELVEDVSRTQTEKIKDESVSMVEVNLEENISMSKKEKMSRINEAADTKKEIMKRESLEVSFEDEDRWEPIDRLIEEEYLERGQNIHIVHDARCIEKENSILEGRQLDMLESDYVWRKEESSEEEIKMLRVENSQVSIKEEEKVPVEAFIVQEIRSEEANRKQDEDRQKREELQRREKEKNQNVPVEQQKAVMNGIIEGAPILELRVKDEGRLKLDEIRKEKNNDWRKEGRSKRGIRMPEVENTKIGIQKQEDDPLDVFLVQETRAGESNGHWDEDRQERKESGRKKEAEEDQIDAVHCQKHTVNGIVEGSCILELMDKEEGRLKPDGRINEKEDEEKCETLIMTLGVENIGIKDEEDDPLDNSILQETRTEERSRKQGEGRQESKELLRERDLKENQMDAVEHQKNSINGIVEGPLPLERMDKIQSKLKPDERNEVKDQDCRKEERTFRVQDTRSEERNGKKGEGKQERKELQKEKESEENQMDAVEIWKDATNDILEGAPILEVRDNEDNESDRRKQEREGSEKILKVQERDWKEMDKRKYQGFTTDGPLERIITSQDMLKPPDRQKENKKTDFRESQIKHTEVETNVKESEIFQVEKDVRCPRKSKEQAIDIREREKMKREKEARERYRKEKEEREREREREKDRITVEGFTQENRGRPAGEQAAIERVTQKRNAVTADERVVEEARERTVREKYPRRTVQAQENAAVDVANPEAGGKATSEVKDRKTSQLRMSSILQEQATAEAREKARAALDRANEEMQERSVVERAAREARARALRAALERVNMEEQQKSGEKSATDTGEMFTEKPDKQRQLVKGASFGGQQSTRVFPFGSHKAVDMRSCSSSVIGRSNSFEFPETEEKPTERERARWERHQRIIERTVRALEEKKQRDLQTQKEQAERHRVAGALDGEINRWVAGKEGNLRALLSTLHYILWQESGWQPVPLTDLSTAASVKKAYRKAALCVHPDKVQQKGASIKQKYIAEKVFDLLKEAWNRFSSDELA